MPEIGEMGKFEEQIRKALERKEPSPDFVSKVLKASEAQSSRPRAKSDRNWWPHWMPAAIAAMLVLFVGLAYQRHERDKAGRRAKAELVMALHLTGDKLHQARAKVATISEMERSY